MNNTKKQGRPTLPPEQRKRTYQVQLRPADADTLARKYGSLQAAVNTALLQTLPEKPLRDALKLIQLAAQDALAASGGKINSKL